MAHIDWKDEYSVGVASIDEDHKQLLAIVDTLHNRLGESAPAETLARICDKLIEHTLVHFGREEGYFEKTNYPRAAAHRLMHEQLKQRILQFRAEIGERPPPVGKFMFFTDWLAHHIMGEDKTLGSHLNEQGIH
jgi:hemerythrin